MSLLNSWKKLRICGAFFIPGLKHGRLPGKAAFVLNLKTFKNVYCRMLVNVLFERTLSADYCARLS